MIKDDTEGHGLNKKAIIILSFTKHQILVIDVFCKQFNQLGPIFVNSYNLNDKSFLNDSVRDRFLLL